MNYRKVNSRIVEGKKLEEHESNEKFYEYLLRNNVAYYYSEFISEGENIFEKNILRKALELNNDYYKTIRYLRGLSNRAGIDIALFKTHKFIPEAVDGDIDLIVKKKDFNNLMNMLENDGFVCLYEGKFKGVCEKEGFLKLEPRSVVSYHGYEVLDEMKIWDNVIFVNTPFGRIKSTSLALDVTALLLNVLYGPKYVRLYLYLAYAQVGREDILRIHDLEDIKILLNKLESKGVLNKKFPLFLGCFEYLYWFLRYLLFTDKMSFFDKTRHFVFFYYSKLKYIFLGKLHFRHRWF